MELETSLSSHHAIHVSFSMNYSILIIPILIILIIFLLSFLITFITFQLIKRRYFHCKCEICHSYVTSNWSQNFPNLCDWYTHLLQNSPTKTIKIHVLNNIITANPKNVEYMLKTNFNNYPKGKPFSTILFDLLGHGIFNADGDAWRFQKKMASLELDRHSVWSYSFDVVKNEIDNQLLPYLSQKAKDDVVFDLQEIFRVFSFATICKFSFGVEIENLKLVFPMKDFSTSFDLATKLSAQRALEVCSLTWKVKRLLGLGSEKKLRDAINKIDALAMEVIKQKRKKHSHIVSDKKDLLSRFMSNMSHSNNDRYLRDIIVSFILAGRDTMASALTSFFLLISHHPKVESAILTELDRVKCQEYPLRFEKIKDQLQYLKAAVFESLRIYPPVQFDSKFALDDDVLPDGTKVKKGTRVTYHPYAMGRMEDIWGKDCLEFKPERWLNKDGVFTQESAFKYPVFQGGVRVCLGKEMALMEINCVIVCVLTEFRLKVVNLNHPCELPRFSPGLTATFKGGLPVLVHRREKGDRSIS